MRRADTKRDERIVYGIAHGAYASHDAAFSHSFRAGRRPPVRCVHRDEREVRDLTRGWRQVISERARQHLP